MRAADPLGASRARRAGPGSELALSEVVTAVEYDIVGEQGGRYAQVRSGIATTEEVRAELEAFAGVNPALAWHVIARTTTTTVEALADHLLTPSATERGHQLHLDATFDLSAPSPPQTGLTCSSSSSRSSAPTWHTFDIEEPQRMGWGATWTMSPWTRTSRPWSPLMPRRW